MNFNTNNTNTMNDINNYYVRQTTLYNHCQLSFKTRNEMQKETEHKYKPNNKPVNHCL